jgi:hypothetical protein
MSKRREKVGNLKKEFVLKRSEKIELIEDGEELEEGIIMIEKKESVLIGKKKGIEPDLGETML